MTPAARFKLRQKSPRGGAVLIITLLLVVLIVIVVLAFLDRATSNGDIETSRSKQILAEQAATSGSDYVIGQFLQEIAANSITTTNSTVVTYLPATNTFAVPQCPLPSSMTSNTNFLNLIRRSVNETTNGIGETNASTNNTVTPSLNGRVISFSRWNAPMLLTSSGFTSTNQTPNWIYLNQDGTVTATPSTKVIARFAYNAYNTGGLLDANIAGYPTSVSGTNLVSIESTLAGADLSVIPGVTSPNTFVQWRNQTSSLTAYGYVTAVTNAAASGFHSPPSGDQRITSRQDLITVASNGSYGITTNSLPYLTHFTRELSAPSWGSQTNFPNVVASSTETITRYRIDGTSYTYQINAGQPALARRFPLDRITWLGVNGPQNNGTTASIQACFGLLWDSTNSQWDYVGPTGTTIQSSIASLATVASQGREPNFFEVLKAGILAGSIGQGPADDQGTLGMNWHPAYSLSNNDNAARLSSLSDYQIIQIGVNIIDQYDTSGVPTAIVFDSALNTLTGPFYGVENLPYVNKLYTRLYRPSSGYDLGGGTTQPSYQRWLRGWMAVEMWNPHRNAAVAPAMRLVLSGGTLQFFDKARKNSLGATVRTSSPYNNASGGGTRYSSNYGLTSQSISFSNSTFATPTVLTPAAAGGTASNSASQGQLTDQGLSWTGFWLGDLNEPDYELSGTTAQITSEGLDPTQDIVDGTTTHGYQVGPDSNNVVLNLQMQITGGSWRTIQTIYQPNQESNLLYFYFGASNTGNTSFIKQYTGTSGTHVTVGSHPLAFADPRTQRFGMSVLGTYQPSDPSQAAWQNTTLRGGVNPQTIGRFMRTTGCYPYIAPNSATYINNPFIEGQTPTFPSAYYLSDLCENLSSKSAYVADNDSVIRPGDGTLATPAGYDALGLTSNLNNVAARPYILNRPFNSVAELGYAFRDQPWKTLDFISNQGADRALLDLFSLHDQTTNFSAGKLNLNSARVESIASLISGINRTETVGASTFTSAQALTLATSISGQIASQHLLNIGDSVLAFANLGSSYNSNFGTLTQDAVVKSRREAALRALIGAGQVRTWGLLIDVIAQSGHYIPTGGSADNFTVEGESRCWQNVAIDRFTGQVVNRQQESISQ